MFNKIEKEKEQEDEINIPESWDDSDLHFHTKGKKKASFVFKLFFISLLFFIITMAIFSLSFFVGGTDFSEKKIIVSAIGPVNISSGEEGEVVFGIDNNNTVSILDAYIEYSYDAGENSSGNKNIINKKIEIGEISSKSSVTKTTDFTFFGSEGMKNDIQATFYYKVHGSKAEFNKKFDIVSIIIKTSPVSISVKNLKEIRQGDSLSFIINIKNNTNSVINNLIFLVKKPNDFVFDSSSIPSNNSIGSWLVQELFPGKEKEIIVSGRLLGDIGSSPSFTFLAGVSNSTSTNYHLNIDNIYSKVERSILITGQYMDINISSDNTLPNNIVRSGDFINLEFSYKNNLSSPIENVTIIGELIGDNIDIFNTYSQNGVVNRENKTVIWNSDTNKNLAKVGGNAEGKLNLKIRVNDKINEGNNITLKLKAKGDRNAENEVTNNQDISLERVWYVSID